LKEEYPKACVGGSRWEAPSSATVPAWKVAGVVRRGVACKARKWAAEGWGGVEGCVWWMRGGSARLSRTALAAPVRAVGRAGVRRLHGTGARGKSCSPRLHGSVRQGTQSGVVPSAGVVDKSGM